MTSFTGARKCHHAYAIPAQALAESAYTPAVTLECAAHSHVLLDHKQLLSGKWPFTTTNAAAQGKHAWRTDTYRDVGGLGIKEMGVGQVVRDAVNSGRAPAHALQPPLAHGFCWFGERTPPRVCMH